MNARLDREAWELKKLRKHVSQNVRHHRKRGEFDLANAASEFLFALKAGYSVPSYRGLSGEAG